MKGGFRLFGFKASPGVGKEAPDVRLRWGSWRVARGVIAVALPGSRCWSVLLRELRGALTCF